MHLFVDIPLQIIFLHSNLKYFGLHNEDVFAGFVFTSAEEENRIAITGNLSDNLFFPLLSLNDRLQCERKNMS